MNKIVFAAAVAASFALTACGEKAEAPVENTAEVAADVNAATTEAVTELDAAANETANVADAALDNAAAATDNAVAN